MVDQISEVEELAELAEPTKAPLLFWPAVRAAEEALAAEVVVEPVDWPPLMVIVVMRVTVEVESKVWVVSSVVTALRRDEEPLGRKVVVWFKYSEAEAKPEAAIKEATTVVNLIVF